MSSYTPAVGDRVRVTLEARVTHVSGGDYFSADGWDFGLDDPGIKVEKIADPLPTRPGSVVWWLGSHVHLTSHNKWVDDNGDYVRDNDFGPHEVEVIFDAGAES